MFRPAATDYTAGNGPTTFEAIFRSDTLLNLRSLLQGIPWLAPFARQLIRIELVIDANIVQEEIRWLLKRRNLAARSSLQEVIDSGVVVALAPQFLESEIEEHIDRIARETGRTTLEVWACWLEIRARIHLYQPASNAIEVSAIDPDDVPYKQVYDELGADGVYSRDSHLRKMSLPVIQGSPTIALREYARATSVSVGISVTSGLVLTISFASLRGAYLLVEKSLKAIGDFPMWLKIVMAGAIAAAIIHPKSRAKITETWHRFRTFVEATTPGLVNAIETMALQYLQHHETATQKHLEIVAALPPTRRRRSALQFARSICLISKVPLSAGEIASMMRSQGYETRSANLPLYIQRRMRESGQFIEFTPGRWGLPSGRPTFASGSSL